MRTVDILDDYMTRNVQQTNDEMVALYDREETPVSSQVRYLSSIVYALLSHCTAGSALATVNKAVSGDQMNGYEAFRHLNDHYAMNDTNRALVSFNKIANLKLHGDDLQAQLIAWEKEVATYERSMETTFSEKYKLHAVINGTTGSLHSHLSYHLRSITTYQQLRQMIFDHQSMMSLHRTTRTPSRHTADHGGPTPMEIDAYYKGKKGKGKGKGYSKGKSKGKGYQKGKGKGKGKGTGKGYGKPGSMTGAGAPTGKGKGKGKNGGCHNCGSTDHWLRDCPHNRGVYGFGQDFTYDEFYQDYEDSYDYQDYPWPEEDYEGWDPGWDWSTEWTTDDWDANVNYLGDQNYQTAQWTTSSWEPLPSAPAPAPADPAAASSSSPTTASQSPSAPTSSDGRPIGGAAFTTEPGSVVKVAPTIGRPSAVVGADGDCEAVVGEDEEAAAGSAGAVAGVEKTVFGSGSQLLAVQGAVW